MDRSSLEELITWDKSAIAAASLVVAVGLIGEYWKEIKKLWLIYWEIYPIEFRRLLFLVAKESRKTFLFPILVVAGVSAEWLYESDSSVREAEYAKLLDDDNSRHTDAERDAIDQASSAEKETQELKAKNLALEAEIAPRKVSDDDVKVLIDSLKPFAGIPISVKSYLGDSEGRRLLMILSVDLSRSGLKVTPGYWNFDASPKMMLLEGLELDSPPEQKDLADALQKSFSKMRLGIRPQWYAMAAGTPVTLYIGVKPFQIPGVTPP